MNIIKCELDSSYKHVAEAQAKGVVAVIDMTALFDPTLARKAGANLLELLVSMPESEESAINMTNMLLYSKGVDTLIVVGEK